MHYLDLAELCHHRTVVKVKKFNQFKKAQGESPTAFAIRAVISFYVIIHQCEARCH